MAGWIGVDFDGTLSGSRNDWTGFNDGRLGPPIMPMVERVQRWLAEGKDVRIFTARVGPGADVPLHTAIIDHFCLEHFGRTLPITATKDWHMEALWDDKAVGLEPNTGIPLDVAATRDIAELIRAIGDESY